MPLIVIGCTDSSTTTTATTVSVPVAPVTQAPLTAGGKLVLFNKPGNADSDKLSVGDPSTVVDKLFPPGSATVNRDLPKGLDNNYSGESFDENGSGFGVIYYRGSVSGSDTQGGTPAVVMAMRYEAGLNRADVDSTVLAYETTLGKPTSTILGPITSYKFWEDRDRSQRLMICYVRPRQDSTKLNLTVAVGDDTVMDKLRMDLTEATKDSASVQPLQPVAPAPG